MLLPLTDPHALTALRTHPQRDVYHDPAYLRSVADAQTLFVVVRPDVVIPLVVRALPAWLNDTTWRDAESPYGYAAPLISGPVDWTAVAAELAAAHIVNLFLRSHPFALWYELPVVHQAPTVAIPLSAGRDAAFAGGRCATQRSQVNRARKLGFTVTTEPAPQDLSVFRELYEGTMQRLDAADFYRFSSASWAALSDLGDHLALISVRDSTGAVHAQALFLRGPRWAHYHLSARTADAHNASSHLLFEAAADWAIAHGCAAIHLGGGTSGHDDDPLLAFKRRIGKDDAQFRTAGVIADATQHQRLIDQWTAASWLTPRWFQAYRQPLPVA